MKKRLLAGVALLICAVLIAYPGINAYLYSAKSDKIESTVQMRVTWKERISYGTIHQQHYYLIYGELADGTPCVLQNTDSRFRGKYNGSDIYQQIDIGKVYTFFATGEREYRRARYPNIISIINETENWIDEEN